MGRLSRIAPVRIGERWLGVGQPCYILAEIGINHNGNLDQARQLIAVAAAAGCDAVKFQKRTVSTVYTPAELNQPRPNPFGSTNGDLKRGLEFGQQAYEAIAAFCRHVNIPWFASAWDDGAVDFLEQFDPPAYKLASASLTNDGLLRRVRATGKPVLASTGMSTYEEIDHAVEVLDTQDLILMHSTSVYPAKMEQLNLQAIPSMMDRYGVPVGYSGHETGTSMSVAATVLGACCVERHITLDRTMWGSDQAASLEPQELTQLVRDIRHCAKAMGDGIKRIYEEEVAVMKKLRRIGLAV